MKVCHLPPTIFCLAMLAMLSGCGPSAQDLYDEAARQVKQQQERLDNLRPAYDAARQKVMLAVTKEFAGATTDENAQDALKQLEGLSAQAGSPDLLAGDHQDQLDAAVDYLTQMQSAIATQQDALLGGVTKMNETMQNIETPGTPENKRFEEMLEALPEVQAYRRQEQRLELATNTMLEAEKQLTIEENKGT